MKHQHKNMTDEEIKKEIDKDRMTQVTVAFSVALNKIFTSNKSVDIKTDALHAAITFFESSIMSNTAEIMARCHKETKAPMEIVVGQLGYKFMEREARRLERFRTMMLLFDMDIRVAK